MGTISEKLQYTVDAINDIQAAINEKGGSVDGSVELGAYGGKIREIKGEENLGSGNIRVDFLYIDPQTGVYKTVTKRCNKGETMTAPKATDIPAIWGVCPALTFQEWNHDLSVLTNIQSNYCIGATYIPTDGYTWYKIHATKTTGENLAAAGKYTLYFSKSDNSTLTVIVEDFNGRHVFTETTTNKSDFNISFSLSSLGDYWIKTKITEGAGTYSLNMNNSNRATLCSAFIGYKATVSTFEDCTALTSLTIPKITELPEFKRCIALTSIVIPKQITFISGFLFEYCNSLNAVSIPQIIPAIDYGTFSWCTALSSFIMPQNVTHFAYQAFNYCSNLKIVDFTKATQVIQLLYALEYIDNKSDKLTLYVVPDFLYPQFIVETNWATIADCIISETDYNTYYGSR